MAMQNFFRELKERKVIKVSIAYIQALVDSLPT